MLTAAGDVDERASSAASGKDKKVPSAAAAAPPEMRGREKLDFLLKQTELFTQFILMQGRGLKPGSAEAKKLVKVQTHAISQMRALSHGNSILGTNKRKQKTRVNLSYGEGAKQDDEQDGQITLTRLD